MTHNALFFATLKRRAGKVFFGGKPYFSNNTAATLEDMLEHYKQFFKRVEVQNAAAPLLTTQPGVLPPVIDRPFTDAEVPALLAYLRKI